MATQPSIIIADDHPLILKGLQEFLQERNYAIEACASDGKAALSFIEKLKPDIAILDIQMPHYTGLEIAKICAEKNHKTKIIFITLEKDEKLYQQAKDLNIYGYVLKEFALTEIEQCIDAVQNNKSYFSPELIKHLKSFDPPKEIKLLTKVERKVLLLISEKKTAKDIASVLSISSRTVEKHKSNIRHKLALESKSESLFLFAVEHKHYLD